MLRNKLATILETVEHKNTQTWFACRKVQTGLKEDKHVILFSAKGLVAVLQELAFQIKSTCLS
jgi:hypothetical protein